MPGGLRLPDPAGLKLGVITNTQDTTGEVLETRPVQVSREQLEAVLEQFRGDGEFVLAAISSSPLLLGRAGLLEGRRFTHGMNEEFLDAFPVAPREGIVRKH